jgi:hypothetical protein
VHQEKMLQAIERAGGERESESGHDDEPPWMDHPPAGDGLGTDRPRNVRGSRRPGYGSSKAMGISNA